MGGSVAVGTLIVGIGLLGVFVIANDAIIAQMETSVEVIEAEDDPSPSIRIRDANLAEDAIISVDVNSAGTGYTTCVLSNNCRITASGTTGGSGWYASYTVSGGGIDEITIQAYGSDYTGTITFTIDNPNGNADATLQNPTIGNIVYANASNDGSVSIDVDDMWISVEGLEPDLLTNSYSTFGTFFPTEIIPIVYLEGGSSGLISSVTITADGAIATRAGL